MALVSETVSVPGPEGWGSHEPALRAIARFMDIHSVIEFGLGLHSTSLFLDRRIFPLLESLVSFEHMESWVERAKTDDPRHTVVVTGTENFAARSAGMKADFVFLDSGPGRSSLISHCLTLAPVFAVHDHQAGELEEFCFTYIRGFNAKIQTVFASNTVDLAGIMLA